MSGALVPLTDVANQALVPFGPLPSLVFDGGRPAETAWDDFFNGVISNRHTRVAYERAVRCFLAWVADKLDRQGLHEITAGDVGKYIRSLAPEKQSISKKKQHLAALRQYFNLQVERHICLINPAAVTKTEKLSVREGKTPIISSEQALQLYDSIDCETLVGKRDRAVLATLNFTGARAGAVAALNLEHLERSDTGWSLRFMEKNNRHLLKPVAHDLQFFLHEWLEASGIGRQRRQRNPKTGLFIPRPLFRSVIRKEQRLSPYVEEELDPKTGKFLQRESGRLSGKDINRMMKRRLKDAGLPDNLGPHSYRVAVATDLEEQGDNLETRQHFLGHADPRTTQVYSRTKQQVSRNLVERIRIGRRPIEQAAEPEDAGVSEG